MKVLTLKPVRLNGKDEPAGKAVEIPDDLAKIWCNPPWNLATTELREEIPEETPPIIGVDLAKGEDITVADGSFIPKDDQPDEDAEPEPDPVPDPDDDQPEDEFPKHVGGGYYILPDGSKIHGKQAALDALAELSRGD